MTEQPKNIAISISHEQHIAALNEMYSGMLANMTAEAAKWKAGFAAAEQLAAEYQGAAEQVPAFLARIDQLERANGDLADANNRLKDELSELLPQGVKDDQG
jgi:hypothetical protein